MIQCPADLSPQQCSNTGVNFSNRVNPRATSAAKRASEATKPPSDVELPRHIQLQGINQDASKRRNCWKDWIHFVWSQKKMDSQKLPGLCDSENVTLSDGRHWARNGQELNENRRSCHICFSQLSWNHCKSGKRSAALRDWCIRFFNALTYALALSALIWNGMIKISQQLGRPQVEPQLLKHGMAFDGNVACSEGNTVMVDCPLPCFFCPKEK